jgi:hypothetical protein
MPVKNLCEIWLSNLCASILFTIFLLFGFFDQFVAIFQSSHYFSGRDDWLFTLVVAHYHRTCCLHCQQSALSYNHSYYLACKFDWTATENLGKITSINL